MDEVKVIAGTLLMLLGIGGGVMCCFPILICIPALIILIQGIQEGEQQVIVVPPPHPSQYQQYPNYYQQPQHYQQPQYQQPPEQQQYYPPPPQH
jgi:hypothetical protein